MKRVTQAALVVLAAGFLAAVAPNAHAQRAAFVRLFRPYHQVVLAQLDEVAKDLKLTDEQKEKVTELSDTLNEERGALIQEAAGDFDSIREEMANLVKDIAAELNEALDETQQKRLQEIYVQANGPTAVFDDKVAEAIKLTDEQKEKLQELRTEIRNSLFQGGIDWQSLSEEEADKKVDELIAEQNEKYSAVLTDEQRTEFEKLQGEKLEIDLANLPNPFGR
jgi:Spy/CpxP family protein refolding chaperone